MTTLPVYLNAEQRDYVHNERARLIATLLETIDINIAHGYSWVERERELCLDIEATTKLLERGA